jgi:hypothetical protein
MLTACLQALKAHDPDDQQEQKAGWEMLNVAYVTSWACLEETRLRFLSQRVNVQDVLPGKLEQADGR